jgi:hypothetical protein
VTDAADDDNRWHLDKKVPIALITALTAQAVGGVWMAGQLAQRQDDQERRLSTIERHNVSGRISVLESQVNDVRDGVRRIDGKLDRLLEGRR